MKTIGNDGMEAAVLTARLMEGSGPPGMPGIRTEFFAEDRDVVLTITLDRPAKFRPLAVSGRPYQESAFSYDWMVAMVSRDESLGRTPEEPSGRALAYRAGGYVLDRRSNPSTTWHVPVRALVVVCWDWDQWVRTAFRKPNMRGKIFRKE